MRKIYLTAISYLFIIGFFIQASFAQTQTKTYNVEYGYWSGTNSEFTWEVPCGVTKINVQAWGSGAGGSRGNGGGGGGAFASQNDIAVVPGTVYTIIVGKGAEKGSGDDGEFSRFMLVGTNIVAAEGGGPGSGNRIGGRASNSIGSIKFSGGNGGESSSGRGGAGGGGSAGSTENGSNGAWNNGNTGGAGGNGGNLGGADGGNGGNRNRNGRDGDAPGAGGGERGRNGNRSGAGGDGRVIISYTGMADYCIPGFYNTEPITFVNLDNQISNLTSASTSEPDYETFCMTADLARGNSYNIKVKGNTVGDYKDYVTVFIDWDQDGNLNGAGEQYNIGIIENSNGTDSKEINATITVPLDATLGITKMRVYKNYDRYESNACSRYNTYGQVEDYKINVIGDCVQPTGATVTDGTNTSATSLIVCAGTKVTLRQTGGTKGTGTWEWRSGSCNGTLVGNSTELDAALEINPPIGTTTYYVHTTCGAGACASVTVVVNMNGLISYTSGGQNLTICKGTPINPYVVYNVDGGATSASIAWSPSQPSGISGVYNSLNKTFEISGTANQAGTFNYTITLGGNSPCTNNSISGSLTVSEGPNSLSYTNNSITYCSGGLITENEPIVSGGAPTSYSVSPALPLGLSIDAVTGIISGTPTIPVSTANYTVTAENTCGSTTTTLTITISSGDQIFNVTPSGPQVICSAGGSVLIGLTNSATNVSYQLLKDGIATGPAVPGSSGNSISFGYHSTVGFYSVETNSSCATKMNGSTTISVTPQPNTQFTYSSYVFCKSGNSTPAIITGLPKTGTFSASPVGLVFTDNATGEIDLDQTTPGIYNISYTVPATGGCSIYTYTQTNTVQVSAAPIAYQINGSGEFCEGNGGLPITLSSSQLGIKYQLYLDYIATSTIIDGTGSSISFGNQTTAGIYTVRAYYPSGTQCATFMNGEAEIIMHPKPAAISISALATTFCGGTIMPLRATFDPTQSVTGNVTISSSDDVTIPDNNSRGMSSLLKVIGIPSGATITSVQIQFRIDEDYDKDLIINLKGPNGNVLNIANGIGGNNQNFGTSSLNTTVSSNATNNIAFGAAPFAGTYLPQAEGGVIGAGIVTNNISNVTNFFGLFGSTASSANGNWRLSARDKNSQGSSGELRNWSVTINYSTITNPTIVTWLPVTGLYTDPGGITPYTLNTPAATVYAKPTASGTYTATSTNEFGCSTTKSISLTVNPSPNITIQADYCGNPGSVRITATSDIPVNVNSWTWSNGPAKFKNNTYSYIDVNTAGSYYASAQSQSNSCPSTAVMSVAQELVTNGNFEQGNTGFTSDYYYQPDVAGNNELVDHLNPFNNGYGIGTDAQNYHSNFWGVDHTYGTGDGNFMIVNGHGNLVVWKNENITVLPNTTYYFSAWAMSLNRADPYAELSFKIGTSVAGTSAPLTAGVNDNSNNGWTKLYGSWTSGPSQTSVDIYIVNLEPSLGGNDFGLDDVSFGTLSTFLNLTSTSGTDGQTVCGDVPITPISYEVGGNGTAPTFSGLPAGLSTYWNGRDVVISGTPTISGTFSYQITAAVCEGAYLTKNGTLTVLKPSNAGTFLNPVISACYGSSGTISLTSNSVVGNILNWQVSNDKITWTDIPNSANKFSETYSNIQSAIYYRSIAQNGAGCQTNTSPIVKVGIRNLWTGEENTDFTDIKNWSDERVPTVGGSCPTVVIPAVTNLPILSYGNPNISKLQINTNASLQITGTGILGIAGSITNNGIFDVKEGTLDFNGLNAQSISGSILKDKTIKNLIVSNTSANGLEVSNTLNDTLNILGTLSFGTATSKLNSGNNITLKSTAGGTANVGKLATGNVISGNFVVERFINMGSSSQLHGKSWQLIATPTKGQTIFEAWMENGDKSIHRYGTQISGYGSGFDVYSRTPALKYYDYSSKSWKGVGSTNITLYKSTGYLLFVRGDRTVTYPNTSNTTLRTKGTLITGTTVPITVHKDNFESVGNPYASAIDLRKIKRTGNVDSYITVWDPTLGQYYGLGAYQYLYTNGVGDYLNLLPSPGYGPAGTINNYIQSGQAFFVQATGGDGTVYFEENAKASGSKLLMRKQGGINKSVQLYTSLGAKEGNQYIVSDGTLIQYNDDYDNAIDGLDARKITNTSLNFAIKSNGKLLAIERRKTITEADTIFFNLTGVKVLGYQFKFEAENLLADGLEGWLEDTYLQTRVPLNLNGTTTVNFKIENKPGSYATNRFRIVFKAAAAPLPVTFTGIIATRQNDDIEVQWNVESESNMLQYEVEKSKDGINFAKIAITKAANSGTGIYKYLDEGVQDGYHYYRIRSISINGKTALSQVVKVLIEANKGAITIFPNPIVNGVVNLQLKHQQAGDYRLRLFNPVGQLILDKSFKHSGGNRTEKIDWDYNLAHGMYQLEITKPEGKVKIIRVMY